MISSFFAMNIGDTYLATAKKSHLGSWTSLKYNTTVLAPVLNMAMPIYFHTYSIINQSINFIAIITITLVNNLISVDYLCLQP